MAHLTIERVSCHAYALPLARPLYFGDSALKERQGMIICMISADGYVGFGEVAPLPGMSQEDLKTARYQADKLAAELKGMSVPLAREELLAWLKMRFDVKVYAPSVRFGFESAVLLMAAAAQDMFLCDYLREDSAVAVRVAGLLQGSVAEIAGQAGLLLAQGYSTFKLKIGARNIPLDVHKVEDVKKLLGPKAVLRLDAGRAWRFDEAILFAQNIGKNQIEYIEEPCNEPARFEEFYRRTDMPVAVDESFDLRVMEDLSLLQGVQYFILRPTTTTGVTGFLDVMKAAGVLGAKVVVSSAFESGIGLTALANLAVLTGEPAGLGTAAWFEHDLLTRPVVTAKGLIPVDRLNIEAKFFDPAFVQNVHVM
ncbi:MAG: o-succinylbenzoate synthase [Candidatus Omnitrophica bacterium]|nr:o-succinylbenzoate synthase [Candidatus Omnitrophota bacterium]